MLAALVLEVGEISTKDLNQEQLIAIAACAVANGLVLAEDMPKAYKPADRCDSLAQTLRVRLSRTAPARLQRGPRRRACLGSSEIAILDQFESLSASVLRSIPYGEA